MHRQYLEQASQIQSLPVPLRRLNHSETILSMTNKIQRIMHADHALLLFTHTLHIDDAYESEAAYTYALFFNFD
jgi:hypothetical protein